MKKMAKVHLHISSTPLHCVDPAKSPIPKFENTRHGAPCKNPAADPKDHHPTLPNININARIRSRKHKRSKWNWPLTSNSMELATASWWIIPKHLCEDKKEIQLAPRGPQSSENTAHDLCVSLNQKPPGHFFFSPMHRFWFYRKTCRAISWDSR